MTEKLEYPKMVYFSSDPKDHKIIKTKEEWPDDAKAHWLDFDEDADTPDPSKTKKAATAKEAKAAKAKAAKEAKAAEEARIAYREEIYKYLDEHNVDYEKAMSDERLEATKKALDQHLESKKDDAQQ